VHLPGVVGPSECTDLAIQVIEMIGPLSPHGYVVHLNNPALPLDVPSDPFATPPEDLTGKGGGLAMPPPDWLDLMRHTLDRLAPVAGGHEHLCIENLSWPPELFEPLLDDMPVSLCVDVGHLWRRRRDPLPYLVRYLSRTRVIHLHGCDSEGQDHQPLGVTPESELQPVLRALLEFPGVLTLEVFGEPDFQASRTTLSRMWEEIADG
jgi:sugar phosphate isomerase/epimerase